MHNVNEYTDGHDHNADDGYGWEPDHEVPCENVDPADPTLG